MVGLMYDPLFNNIAYYSVWSLFVDFYFLNLYPIINFKIFLRARLTFDIWHIVLGLPGFLFRDNCRKSPKPFKNWQTFPDLSIVAKPWHHYSTHPLPPSPTLHKNRNPLSTKEKKSVLLYANIKASIKFKEEQKPLLRAKNPNKHFELSIPIRNCGCWNKRIISRSQYFL